MRAALEEILGWAEIVRSPQLSKFLRYIVEAKLRGDDAGIKAYSIAVDVFGRPSSFDPQTDPIVRVQARRLRGLLQEFYRQGLARSSVRIALPVGRYVPEFDFAPVESSLAASEAATADAPPASLMRPGPRFSRRFWTQAIAAAALVLLLGGLLLGLQVLRQPPATVVISDGLPHEPIVYVSSFSNLSGEPSLDTFASRLNDQVSSLLAQFEDVEVRFADANQAVDRSEGTFLLAGTIGRTDSGINVSAALTDTAVGSTVWDFTVARPLPRPEDEMASMDAARLITRELGPFRSPLHARGRRWLDANPLQLPGVNGYVCLLTFRYAREFTNPVAIAKAIDCHDRLLAQQPDLPLALAAEAWLEGRVIFAGASLNDQMDTAMAEPLATAERARELAPESSFTHEQLASIQNWQERYAAAQRNYAIALGFEPLNTDARAGYAVTLARGGDWNGAAQQAQFAIADTPYPSPWYYSLPSLLAFRDGRYAEAIEEGRIAAQGGEIGAIVTLAAGGLARDRAAIADFAGRVMSMESLRRGGIMPWLQFHIKDRAVLGRLAEGLLAGGIPESALTAQF